jgi:hypothetical protein
VNIYDRAFKKLDVTYKGYPSYAGPVERPGCYEEMISVAEALADGEPFVRVDLYEVGRPVFGELTYTPMAGLIMFDPPDFDKLLEKSYREFAK